ncbi:hypothetical protein CEP51_008706 [Fusarium floridanum]|uniref:Uncharacterized protein n=1 Tax=Fusarium floridanum TaxID=1325733 RepID=A0A428RJZ6_9HYPO|nr:hypothetical protein CEP51_008706 [Fusarium floridanum]
MFQRVYPSQGIGYEATCAAAGTVCRNPPTALKLNGQRITSQYCQFHACRQVEGGRACPNAKLPRAVVCSQHIRCQAVDNGTRCNLDVKDGNSALYRYCTPLHLCILPGCEAQRTWHNGQDLSFCHEHRCEYDDCRNPKDTGPFCKDHTCDDTHCVAFAQGADPDGPQRYCERHRHCQKPQCSRLCHVRDNGQPSPFCGAHYCEAPDCEAEREGGSHCRDHTCIEQGCLEGQYPSGSGYCKKHTCKTRNCRLKRLGKDYCPYHECVYGGCEGEVVEGGFLFKGLHISYVKTATTVDEAVDEEQNEALDSANTIFVRFVTVRIQRHLLSNSVLVTSVLCQNVTDQDKPPSTDLPRVMLTGSSATDTAADKLGATTRLRLDQAGA